MFGISPRTPIDASHGVSAAAHLHLSIDAHELTARLSDLRSVASLNILQPQERRRTAYNCKHRDVEFDIGDQVLVNVQSMHLAERGENKLRSLYEGPFKILGKVSSNA